MDILSLERMTGNCPYGLICPRAIYFLTPTYFVRLPPFRGWTVEQLVSRWVEVQMMSVRNRRGSSLAFFLGGGEIQCRIYTNVETQI